MSTTYYKMHPQKKADKWVREGKMAKDMRKRAE